MKFVIAFLAVVAVVSADVSHLESTTTTEANAQQDTQPQQQMGDSPSAGAHSASSMAVNREYLPPHGSQSSGSDPIPAHTLGADGYKYKVPQRRFFY